MRVIIKGIFFLFVLLLSSCPDRDDYDPGSTLTIINNSNEAFLVYFDFTTYPDTSLTISNPFMDSMQFDLSLIEANNTFVRENEYIKILESSNLPLMLYLFSRETIEQVSWDEIKEDYLILKRYDLTLDDLETMNWTVVYP